MFPELLNLLLSSQDPHRTQSENSRKKGGRGVDGLGTIAKPRFNKYCVLDVPVCACASKIKTCVRCLGVTRKVLTQEFCLVVQSTVYSVAVLLCYVNRIETISVATYLVHQVPC